MVNLCAFSTVTGLPDSIVENHFVLRSVILKDAAHILGAREQEQIAQKNADADQAVGHVDREAAGERGNAVADSRGQIQRNELIQEDEERQEKTKPRVIILELISPDFSPSLARLRLKRGIERKLGASRPSAMVWPILPRPRSTGYLKIGYLSAILRNRVLLGDDLAVGLAHGDAVAVRRQHHHAFHHRLAADERFFTAFQHGQHLQMRGQAQESSNGHGNLRSHYTAEPCGAPKENCPIQDDPETGVDSNTR